MNLKRRSKVLAVVIGLLLGGTLTADSPTRAQGDTADYKVPDGYIKAPFADFTGVLMLDQKHAAGMFVVYLDNKESSEAVQERLLRRIAQMFFQDGKNQNGVPWTIQPLPSRPGDGGGAALRFYRENEKQLQAAVYERNSGPRRFLYGYFAMRHASARDDDGTFLDDQGRGVKAFEKLWKSFTR